MNEKWTKKYKSSINCKHPKGFSQKAHCQGRKKRNEMTIEEKVNLFLEKNCPTDPGKWSASKAAAKSKFDVYPSAYANGWAAKNYKSKGGGWRTCKESVEYNELSLENFDEIKVLTKEEFMNECWEGYKEVGGKMKNGKMVPNCVPVKEDINSDDDVNYGKVEPEEYDVDNHDDYIDFISYIRKYNNELKEATCDCMTEAEYQGRNVPLGKPMRGDVKKFKVYVKNPAGRVVKVNFGDPNMRIKKSNPARRKSFRARHNCANPGPRTKARYWSCRKW